jgi:uncharacterized membrane protein YphA (DoxX/SURF4 family)
MTSVLDDEKNDDEATHTTSTPWHFATRIAFRFCFAYFGLFCLTFAQITFAYTGVLGSRFSDRAVMWQMVALDPVTRWVGRTVFGVDAALNPDSGSGDQAAIWSLIFCLLVVAVGATVVWSVFDRRRTSYPRLEAWFLVFLRLCLGGQMLFYGFGKVIPTQMPATPLAALLHPFGDLSPLAVLWLQVGSSHPYEIALGTIEVVAGLLLFLPRTATLGALLSLASMAQVFLLNMTYDVPVKLLSFHLLLISAVLLAPQAGRLANLLVLARPAQPATQPPLFTTDRRNRIAAAVQVALGVWVTVGCVVLNVQMWHEVGGGSGKPELYGIWEVTEFTTDGTLRPPLTTDETRWQRLVFDTPGTVTYQRMDGELVDAIAAAGPNTLTLTQQSGTDVAAPMATFTVDQTTPDRLRLDGRLDGRPVTISLRRQPLDGFLLLNRGFHWVQEQPLFK